MIQYTIHLFYDMCHVQDWLKAVIEETEIPPQVPSDRSTHRILLHSIRMTTPIHLFFLSSFHDPEVMREYSTFAPKLCLITLHLRCFLATDG